jgi:hypothetical protein
VKRIIAIKCKNNYYVSLEDTKSSYNRYSSEEISAYLFDGKTPNKTFHKDWLLISGYPKKTTKMVRQPDINHRYELIDKSMANEKLPLVFSRDDVAYYSKENYCWIFKQEYQHLQSLYSPVADSQPDKEELSEYQIEVVLEANDILASPLFDYEVYKSRWTHEGTRSMGADEIHHSLVDQIVYPSIILPSLPCKLTSKQVYDIVRLYVKQHMNYDVAEITSDYEFCFTVQKKIPLSEVEEFTVNLNLFSGRKPKYQKRFRRERKAVCFEMTYAPECYKGYTPISELVGDNEQDLKSKLDDYCRELITFINEPVRDCQHCKGLGVINWEVKKPL